VSFHENGVFKKFFSGFSLDGKDTYFFVYTVLFFVLSSCGSKSDSKPETCTVKVVRTSGEKVLSSEYPTPVEKAKAPTGVVAGKDLPTDTDQANKSATYTCE
jgi:hypothetical protein